MFFSRAEKNQKAKGRVEWRSVGACGRDGAGRRNSLRSDIRRPDRPAVAALPAILQCALPCGYVGGSRDGGGVWGNGVLGRVVICRLWLGGTAVLLCILHKHLDIEHAHHAGDEGICSLLLVAVAVCFGNHLVADHIKHRAAGHGGDCGKQCH